MWVAGVTASVACLPVSAAWGNVGLPWQKVPSPGVGRVARLDAVSGGRRLWAVGGTGGRAALVLRWSDGWRAVRTPAVGAAAELYGVARVSRRNAWAVGAVQRGGVGRALIERWSGGAWRAVTGPPLVGGSRLLAAAAVPASAGVWAVGATQDDTTSLIEEYDGTHWKTVAAPSPGGSVDVLDGVAAASRRNAWTVGWQATAGATRCLAELWDGASWRIAPTPARAGCKLSAVAWVPGTKRSWAVGSATGADGMPSPLVMQWHAGAWQAWHSPAMHGVLTGIEAPRPGVAVAVGYRYVPHRGRRPLVERLRAGRWVRVRRAANAHVSQLAGVARTSTRTKATEWAVGWSSKPTREKTLIERHLSYRASPRVPGLSAVRVAPLTLRRVDPCFYASSAHGVWPVAPVLQAHPIRAGFNDPHGGPLAHFGVDVAAHNQAPVYAVSSGVIGSDVRHGTWDEAFTLPPYFYYHVSLGLPVGSAVGLAGRVGSIFPRQYHVHLSEATPTCGLVDPRRPTGILHDPQNTEPPVITQLTAAVANAAAYAPFQMGPGPVPPDPSTPLSLTDLHGVVDIRASVTDTPRHITRRTPQQPEMVAAVRSYVAPLGHPRRRLGRRILAFDGARLIPPARYYQIMAYGTRRIRACFIKPSRPCLTRLILHVAGTGLNTRRFPNGAYLFCVTAVTIETHTNHRCWPIVIHHRGTPLLTSNLQAPRPPATTPAATRATHTITCITNALLTPTDPPPACLSNIPDPP